MSRYNLVFMQLPCPVIKDSDRRRMQNIPLAAACLLAYAAQDKIIQDFNCKILKEEDGLFGCDSVIIKTVLSMKPDILAVSLYTWNIDRTLAICKELKCQRSEMEIWAGGPECNLEQYASANDIIDIMVYGEGEKPFLELLYYYKYQTDLHLIHNIYYTDNGKIIETPYKQQNVKLVSPWLTGHINVNDYDMMLIETKRGCPHACSYCLSHDRYIKDAQVDYEQLEKEMAYAIENNVKNISFLSPLFNNRECLKICEVIQKANLPKSVKIFCEVRAEDLTDEIVQALECAGITEVEVGLQSTNEKALSAVNRRFDEKKFLRGVRLLQKSKIRQIYNLIIGLPFEDELSFNRTLQFLVENRLHQDTTSTAMSVGINTKIRKSAKKYGIVYQSHAPYRVLKTSTQTFEEIKQCIHRCKGLLATSFSSWDQPNFVSKFLLQAHNPNSSKKQLCSYVSLVIDGLFKSDAELEEKSNLISESLNDTITLHLIIEQKDHLQKAAKFLHYLSKKNPYIVMNILIDAKFKVDNLMIEQLDQSICYEPGVLDYDSVYDQEVFEKEYLRISHTFYILTDQTQEIIKQNFIQIKTINEDNINDSVEGKNLLLTFDATLRINEVLAFLSQLAKRYRYQELAFESFILQKEWARVKAMSFGVLLSQVNTMSICKNHVSYTSLNRDWLTLYESAWSYAKSKDLRLKDVEQILNKLEGRA